MTSHIVNHVVVALKEQLLTFVINKMRLASVKQMYKVKHAIDVLTERTIYRNLIRMVARNVSVLEKQHGVKGHVYEFSMLAC